LLLPNHKNVAGWKGLRLCVGNVDTAEEQLGTEHHHESGQPGLFEAVGAVTADPKSEPEMAKIRQSGLSAPSALGEISQTPPATSAEVALLS
jgi:hypothetical protein